ncbi:MAG: ArsA family ATPase [Bdellovibrionales bacterium]
MVNVDCPLVFVTGKGGVGKSMWAASVASHLASRGKRVLLVEFGETSFFGYFFSQPINMNPRQIRPNLDVSIWSWASCLRDYIGHLVKIDKLADLFFENKVMRALIRGAPALKELAILGKATSGVRHYGPELDYDHIVFDCYATGHFLALMRAPVGMYEAIKFGPMGDQSLAIIKTLKDPKTTEYHLVTLLEELPVSETKELHASIDKELNSNIKVIVNKSLRYIRDNEFNDSTFEQSVCHNLQRQNNSWAQLQESLKIDLEVPYFFESDPNELIEKISKEMVK